MLAFCEALYARHRCVLPIGSRSVSSATDSTDASSTDVVAYWKKLLLAKHPPQGSHLERERAVKDLLTAAIARHSGRTQRFLPEQITSIFRSYYETLDASGKLAVFATLARNFGVDHGALVSAISSWHVATTASPLAEPSTSSFAAVSRAADKLHEASQPLYSRLWYPLSHQNPDGLAFVVEIAGDVVQLQKRESLLSHPNNTIPARVSGNVADDGADGRPGTLKTTELNGNGIPAPAAAATAQELKAISSSLRRHLTAWFSPSLLKLERLTWDASPASLLEKVAMADRVHAVSSWQAFRRRLEHDRRVYVWTHPSWPGEPLVALHVALCVKELPAKVQDILQDIPRQRLRSEGLKNNNSNLVEPPLWLGDSEHGVAGASPVEQDEREEDKQQRARRDAGCRNDTASTEEEHTVAVFYSISNMQAGLEGVDLGNNLIKAAARALLQEVPSLRTLATLSPIPGFATWLDVRLARELQTQRSCNAKDAKLITDAEAQDLQSAASALIGSSVAELEKTGINSTAARKAAAGGNEGSTLASALLWMLEGNKWLHHPQCERALRPILMRLVARYVLMERRHGRAVDPVANFHLRNGAYVMRFNWRGDLSEAGMARSHGIMVNYGYGADASLVEDRNREYIVRGKVHAGLEATQALAHDAATLADKGIVIVG